MEKHATIFKLDTQATIPVKLRNESFWLLTFGFCRKILKPRDFKKALIEKLPMRDNDLKIKLVIDKTRYYHSLLLLFFLV